jgi:hypothetical protein
MTKPVTNKLPSMQAYSERLSVPGSWWALALLMGASFGLVALGFGPVPAAVSAVVGLALTAWALIAYGSRTVTVSETELTAGDARIPLDALGTATALDREEARALRMEAADPRAFMLLRSYVPTAVRIEVTDPADPTPYLYLSTRRPAQLVEIVNAVRRQKTA